jgi:hypothetical protein
VVVVGFWPFFRDWQVKMDVKMELVMGLARKINMQDDESGVAESDGDRRNLLQRSG